LVTDHTGIMNLRDTGMVLLASSGDKAYHFGFLAYAISKIVQLPVLHFFDIKTGSDCHKLIFFVV